MYKYRTYMYIDIYKNIYIHSLKITIEDIYPIFMNLANLYFKQKYFI